MKIQINKLEEWSIGLYKMIWENDRFNFLSYKEIENPILTARNIKDRKAEFVADPFLVYENGIYYMFFEVSGDSKDNIGLALSEDGAKWKYQRIVLDEPYHLAYPLVFKWSDKYYMLPETYKTNSLMLYEAIEFPYKWKFSKALIKGRDFGDLAILFYRDKWWLFVSSADCSDLYLYYSDNLEGTWQEHRKSPIIRNDRTKARPAGNILVMDGKIIRIAQNDSPYYGKSVRAFAILELNQEQYQEAELENSPWLGPSGGGWNKSGMHHLSTCKINEGEFLCCVDGKIHRKKYHLDISLHYLLGRYLSKIASLKKRVIKNAN